ncbi:MAG: hypothetical protein KGZ39_05025 [Simkania sp.]|nr:hypothetical protein [Simkania sp.]
MKRQEIQHKCDKCKELRDLTLQLHELAQFSELLSNQQDVYVRRKGKLQLQGKVYTKSIGKWLRLASQLEKVEMNPFRYEEAYYYCEPVGDMLDSHGRHHESIATPLTRFIYVSNALEECYRFSNNAYETEFDMSGQSENMEYLRSYSAQAAYILNSKFHACKLPKYYEHLVENFLKIIKFYESHFKARFDVALNNDGSTSYGLALVRNIRNQVAHGVFPIIEDPEYSFEPYDQSTKKVIINLLGQASRLAAINIQMLLSVLSPGFESESYAQECMDFDTGDHFKQHCTFIYLINLHTKQCFGLNEADYFAIRSEWLDH